MSSFRKQANAHESKRAIVWSFCGPKSRGIIKQWEGWAAPWWIWDIEMSSRTVLIVAKWLRFPESFCFWSLFYVVFAFFNNFRLYGLLHCNTSSNLLYIDASFLLIWEACNVLHQFACCLFPNVNPEYW